MQFQALSQVDLVTALPEYEEGRIFATTAELRWQRSANGTFALLLLTEDESCVPATWTRLGAGWSATVCRAAHTALGRTPGWLASLG